MWQILVAGALAGIVRSILGKPVREKWDGYKTLKSVFRAMIGGAFFAYTLGLTDPIAVFFTALSTDVVWHDGFRAISSRVKKKKGK